MKRLGRIVMSVFADIVIEPTSLIIWLVVGVVAGWLAGLVMKGSGYGVLGDLIIGLIGAVIGGFLFSAIGWSSGGLLGSILVAFVGACVLIFAVRFLRQGRSRF
jgi:uncharacterized membrane protein YeaQ/YmgE (transglycosylase-associated protein family)